MQDLFTVKYSSFPAPVLGWQMGVPHGMGISMQYNNVVVLLKSRIISLPDYPSVFGLVCFLFKTAYNQHLTLKDLFPFLLKAIFPKNNQTKHVLNLWLMH